MGGRLVFGELITGLKKKHFKSSYIAVLIKILSNLLALQATKLKRH